MNILNPDDALHKGLAMVHQSYSLYLQDLLLKICFWADPTINIGPLKVIDHKKMENEATKWLKEEKLNVSPNALQTLSISR